jgi:hypothetical protein
MQKEDYRIDKGRYTQCIEVSNKARWDVGVVCRKNPVSSFLGRMGTVRRALGVLFCSVLLLGLATAPVLAQFTDVCDVDANCSVDRNDLSLILAARNTPADGPDDPRDADGNGIINVLDARKCVLQCTLPRCAIVPLMTITEDILRGGNPPGSDRGVESAAGNLVADAQQWWTSYNGAQIAFMNPGGVRSDLTYAQSAGEGDGVVTCGEAFTFQPFGNTLLTFPMTGEEIVSVLEEQCQPPGSSRPFLHLGVSDGFTYDTIVAFSTSDCTSITVSNVMLNGVALEPTETYNVTANNFLAGGGDNFGTFLTIDALSGLYGGNDLEALINYLRAFSPVAPPSPRVNPLPFPPVVAGGVACDSAMMTCPGGWVINKDPNNGCAFCPCPAPGTTPEPCGAAS